MGCTVREKDGAWWVFICHQGKRKAKRIGTGDAAKKAAKAVAAKIGAKLALGDVGILEPADSPVAVPTFAEVAGQWEQVNSPAWKQGTRITYGNALRLHLLPPLGALPITDITANRVEAWWTALRHKGFSKKHLAILRAILRGICRRAVSLGVLSANPVERIEGRLGRQDTEIRQADYLIQQDLTTLLGAAERVCPREYPIILAMASCGLRIGEAVALQVGDLDVPGLQVHIRRTARRGYVSSPKSGKAGTVDVPTSTMAVLANVREIRQVEAAVQGTEARWLFPGDTAGMPVTPEAVGKALRKALTAAGVRKIRPHDLRHGYATLAIQAGVPLLTVSRQLRHASISTTADLYTHAVPGSNRAAAEALEAVLTRNQTQPPRNLTP
ncbi:MAG TPA: tyrosine-type recombinase/integrase [Nitrospirales bacterium]|nr:tyrosine-type recombinase/integrase [Nitrospirales bacterium]